VDGFGESARRHAAGYTLHLFGKLNGFPPNLVDRGDGDFIAQTGTFYFQGKTGRAALDALYDSFDGKRFPWSECRGHFAVILSWRRRVFLATDALGAYKVYHDRERRFFSSSFVAVQQTQPRVTIDKQGCYEYAWDGATFGEKTFFNEIRMLPKGMLLELTPEPRVLSEWNLEPSPPVTASFEDTAQRCASGLRALFRTYVGAGGPFRLPLSGGYDSRLLLALLLDAGVKPELFIYGRADSAEVRLARQVADGEHLRLEQIDKTRKVSALGIEERMQRASHCLDGWSEDGLFDNGADADDRCARAAGDRLLFNGSVGEIYRNFFNLPDGRYQLRHLVWAFYSYFAPHACTSAFDVEEYEARMIADMRRAICTGADWVTRDQIEALYPLHRGRYWTAREAAVNNRFGRALFPFLEACVIQGTESIPIAYKAYGRLEARIIQIIRPSLANYPTTRGFCPAEPAPLRYKLGIQLNVLRPTWMRQYSYRLRHWRWHDRPAHLTDAAVEAVIDPMLPTMRTYFHPERIYDPYVFNRVCTMEWLSQSPTQVPTRRRSSNTRPPEVIRLGV
jgi:hypothetical protein